MRKNLKSPDVMAIISLMLLWGIFFWRLLTPVAADQASFKQGDFSGQFVAFAAYQYQRFAEGEIPLWNPYNNGGLPFIADTQAAVFYPPRLITIGLSMLSGEWTYNALQMKAIFHILAYSLMMYAFIRRLTKDTVGSVFGAFVGAVVAAYGGFSSGYPPLQLALLEAAIWLPLSALGILEATRENKLNWYWLIFAGFMLGISWMAGHPQTSWFLTYLIVAWFAYRSYVRCYGWRLFIIATFVMGVVTLGITAVTFLPGVEYLALASRADLGFDAKGNGFPFQDILQFIFPGSVSLFSPLYIGIPSLIFVYLAVRYRVPHSLFWIAVAVIALIHSFGTNTAFYHAAYNFVPGLRFFRGQERAAFLVANSLSILAGIGTACYAAWSPADKQKQHLQHVLLGLLILIASLTLLLLVGWLGGLGDNFGQHIGTAFFSTLIVIATYALFQWSGQQAQGSLIWLIAFLIIFELFSVNMDADSNYDSVPYTEQLSIESPPLIQAVFDAAAEQPYRVDGFRGLRDNYGSLYNVADMRGISPLFLSSAQAIIYQDYIHNPLAWELFAARYVFSERDSFSTPTTVIAQGHDNDGQVFLHELRNPRPFALLLYQADVVDSDAFADALLNDPKFDPRQSVIILDETGIELPSTAPDNHHVAVTAYQPEAFTIDISTSENAILSLAHVDYPGWFATLNGKPVDTLRAYGALTAIAIPAGDHTLRMVYNPQSYRIGAIMSLMAWNFVLLLFLNRAIRYVIDRRLLSQEA